MSQKSKTCTGKKKRGPLTEYDSESEASEAAQYAKEKHRNHLIPYQCQTCKKWHLSPVARQTPSTKCAHCVGSDGNPKDSYGTEKDALRRASIIRKESGLSLHAYACTYGNGWHLTKRQSKNEY